MALDFYKAYKDNLATAPSQKYRDDMQAIINSQFENSSSLYTIEEESPYASNLWVNTDVRINHLITNQMGVRLGDDYRELVFKDLSHAKGMGFRYRFSNSVWLTINTDNYKYITNSTTIRRCNHLLKWYNDENKLIQEPCILDYFKFRPNVLKETSDMILPDDKKQIIMQLNDNTQQLGYNKRFIFNKMAWQIIDFDTISYPNLLILTVEQHEIDVAKDDLVNEIAGAFELPVYEITILNNDIELQAGSNLQLRVNITKNGDIINLPVVYKSSDETIATVSNTGLVTGVEDGDCSISVELEDNSNVSDAISATIKNTPINNTIEDIVGDENIPTGVSRVYQIYKYIDGVQQPDTYTFSINNNLGTLTNITGNSVKIKAGKNTGSIILTAQNNVTADIITKNIEIVTLW